MRARRDKSQVWPRLVRSLAIVAAVVFAPPAIDAIAPSSAGAAKQGSAAGFTAQSLIVEGDAYRTVERIEAAADAAGSEVPQAIYAEMGIAPGACEFRVDSTGEVVGYRVKEQADEVFSQVEQRMKDKGWNAVPLGEIEGATFVKESGDYRWVLVTCTQMESSTSVVMRCLHEKA